MILEITQDLNKITTMIYRPKEKHQQPTRNIKNWAESGEYERINNK